YRDAQVALQTLDEITARYGEELPDGSFARFRQHLEGEAHPDDHADPAPLLSTLSGARVRVAGYQLPDRGGPEALAEGLERIYRRGRRATRAAQADPDADHRHELRKRAKDLWHAAQLLRAVDRKRMRKL